MRADIQGVNTMPYPPEQPERIYHPDVGRIVQDDGRFVLVSLAGVPDRKAKGLLLRRRQPGLRAPFGFECLGHHLVLRDGRWYASRLVGGDSEYADECTSGIFRSEVDALVALWSSRRSSSLAWMV